MRKKLRTIYLLITSLLFIAACTNRSVESRSNDIKDSSVINAQHLEHLYTPVTFSDSIEAAGIYIYSEAPGYHLVGDSDEGFTCVDDVSRAALFYLRSKSFSADTSAQKRTHNLIRFILEMQAANGYFYNFLLPGDSINKSHETSRAEPNWWSWRALQTLTEASTLIKKSDLQLSGKIDSSIKKLLSNIKSDLIPLPLTTKIVEGIRVPQWLPAGSATDQAAILLLGLINYCSQHNEPELEKYIRKLADGIVMMQQGDKTKFPYSCFLSWENVWHAYGCDQAYALLKAGSFLKDSNYIQKALAEVDHFYPWLLRNGMKSYFTLTKKEKKINVIEEKNFEQIAYGIRPMIFAATEAYEVTGQQKYADISNQLAGWFFGNNDAGIVMYDSKTGRCYDGILSPKKVNKNSGAESTIEALLALQKIENYPAVKKSLNKYIKQ